MSTLILYYNSSRVPLVVYPGTPRKELLEGICDALGLEHSVPLRFRDSEGNIALVSSYTPTMTELHALVEQDWRWVVIENGILTDDGRTFNSFDGSRGHSVVTAEIPKSGVYYIGVDITSSEYGATLRRPCCVSIGIVPYSLVSLPRGHICNLDLADEKSVCSHIVSAIGVGRGPTEARYSLTSGAVACTIGVLLDMDRRQVIYVDHPRPQEGAIRIDNVPEQCRLVVQGPKHRIRATLRVLEPLPGGVLRSDAALIRSGDKSGGAK